MLIIDDHFTIRQGLNLLLESNGYITGTEASTHAEAVAALKAGSFDLALLDLSLEDGSGLDLLADLADHGVPALVYSMHEDPVTIDRALRCGANGYVSKRDEPDVLLEGVATLLCGDRFLSPRAEQSLSEITEETATDPLLLLSDRERAIFSAVGRGTANTDIADYLSISPRTVETYLSRMVKKLGVKNVPALRKFAISGRR
jgi:DNA-binding NarL/FixJ family response regulator